MTVGRYLSPSGTPLGGKGLAPDDRVIVLPGETGRQRRDSRTRPRSGSRIDPARRAAEGVAVRISAGDGLFLLLLHSPRNRLLRQDARRRSPPPVPVRFLLTPHPPGPSRPSPSARCGRTVLRLHRFLRRPRLRRSPHAGSNRAVAIAHRRLGNDAPAMETHRLLAVPRFRRRASCPARERPRGAHARAIRQAGHPASADGAPPQTSMMSLVPGVVLRLTTRSRSRTRWRPILDSVPGGRRQ